MALPDGTSAKSAPGLSFPTVADAEAELVERCVAGDESACSDLVDQHDRMVYQLAMHLLGEPNEALDLCQEVFLQVFRSLHRFRGQSALRTWIYRITVNQARNRQRWWRRRRVDEQVSLDEHIQTCGDLPCRSNLTSPDRVLGQKELARRIWKALDTLPFDQRTAVILREIEGLSYEEIAFSLGVVVGTVKSRLARARATLRAELRDL